MTCGSLINFESQKITKTVLSTTVAELNSFMKCFGLCQFLQGLWMDISGEIANIRMRTDAKNLSTTARTIMTVFLVESRERTPKDGMSYGRLVAYDGQRMKKIVLSTTVAELYTFMKCFGSC